MPRFYWDFGRAKSYLNRGQTPWTPAVSVFYGLDAALERMLDEGMDAIFERHARIAQRTRDGVKELGLKLFADESCASNTVTAVNVPEGVELPALMRRLQADHDVVLAGGQGALDGKIMRVGHLGYITDDDITQVLSALSTVLPQVGFQPVTSPAGGA